MGDFLLCTNSENQSISSREDLNAHWHQILHSRETCYQIFYQRSNLGHILGKTTILFALKTGHAAPTLPTVGFNQEEVTVDGVKLTIWDCGGQEKVRKIIPGLIVHCHEHNTAADSLALTMLDGLCNNQ